MSKGASEKVSMELAFLAALDAVHADVDLSEIAEIHDWSRAVRGKFHGASIKGTSRRSSPQPSVPSAIVTNAPGSSVVVGVSGSVAGYGSVQYSQMAIPQLIAVCTSESSEGAWSEFVRRFQPLIAGVITKVAYRFRNVSHTLVEDLSQEVYLRLWSDQGRALRSVATGDAFFGFVKVVAARTAQDYFRSAASARRGAGEALEADRVFMEHGLSDAASPEIEREILLEEIDTILKTHKHEPNFERDHAIFWLYYSQGLTAKAIAALPGIKLSAKGVKSVLLQLRRQIWSVLELRAKKPAE